MTNAVIVFNASNSGSTNVDYLFRNIIVRAEWLTLQIPKTFKTESGRAIGAYARAPLHSSITAWLSHLGRLSLHSLITETYSEERMVLRPLVQC